MPPQLIFGTASFGMDGTEFQDKASVSSLLQLLRDSGVRRLDSGARYPPLRPGRSEELIGECKNDLAGFQIDTKIYSDTSLDGSGDLTPDAIDRSIDASLSRLQRTPSEGVNVLHIHRADPATPVRDQVHAFNDQIKKGHCHAWGVSNVPVPMLEEMFRICEEDNLRKPVCYQGQYNIITRGAETELLPLLHKHGVLFNAYSPLAAGFMTGKFAKGEHEGTRFGNDNPLGSLLQKRYGGQDLQTAMADFHKLTEAHGLETLEVAMRWIYYHSALRDQDGIVFGASKERQVKSAMAMVEKGPLPADMLKYAEKLWEAVKDNRGSMM